MLGGTIWQVHAAFGENSPENGGGLFCPECGTPDAYQPPAEHARRHGKAVAPCVHFSPPRPVSIPSQEHMPPPRENALRVVLLLSTSREPFGLAPVSCKVLGRAGSGPRKTTASLPLLCLRSSAPPPARPLGGSPTRPAGALHPRLRSPYATNEVHEQTQLSTPPPSAASGVRHSGGHRAAQVAGPPASFPLATAPLRAHPGRSAPSSPAPLSFNSEEKQLRRRRVAPARATAC